MGCRQRRESIRQELELHLWCLNGWGAAHILWSFGWSHSLFLVDRNGGSCWKSGRRDRFGWSSDCVIEEDSNWRTDSDLRSSIRHSTSALRLKFGLCCALRVCTAQQVLVNFDDLCSSSFVYQQRSFPCGRPRTCLRRA